MSSPRNASLSVLVFGGTGQLGQALQQLYADDTQVLTRADVDLSDTQAIFDKITTTPCRAVINASAFTAVDLAETQTEEAFRINQAAPAAMAKAAHQQYIPFVHVSTDYVFDGTGTAPWRPEDASNPLNTYGESKRAGEIDVLEAYPEAKILRTSWVFSTTGQNFMKTMLRLGQRLETLRIIDDQIGGPTPAKALAKACWLAAQSDSMPGGIYHFAGKPDVSWAGFAERIFEVSGQQVAIERISTAEYGAQPAKRPSNSRLDCTKFTVITGLEPPDWRAALPEMITQVMKDMQNEA